MQREDLQALGNVGKTVLVLVGVMLALIAIANVVA